MDLVAMLPWWAGVGLALVSYLVLHSVASQSVAPVTQAGQVGAMLTQTIWKSLASVGQYVLPIICLVGKGCAKAMVRRTARRGAGAGSDFWGCAGYPACRGTRPIS